MIIGSSQSTRERLCKPNKDVKWANRDVFGHQCQSHYWLDLDSVVGGTKRRDLDIFELSRGANSVEQRKPPKEATFFMDMDVIQKLLLAGISLWKWSLVIDVIKTWTALIAIFGCLCPQIPNSRFFLQEIVYFTAAVSVITRIALIALFGYCCQKTAALVLCQLQRQDQSCKMSIFYTDISVISLTLCQLQRQDRH